MLYIRRSKIEYSQKLRNKLEITIEKSGKTRKY